MDSHPGRRRLPQGLSKGGVHLVVGPEAPGPRHLHHQQHPGLPARPGQGRQAGALGGGVTVAGLNRNSLQGDRAICTLLSAMGAGTAWSGSSCTAAPGPLQPLQVDARSIPDLVPILAVTASAAPGTTRVEHAGRLRLKESDRLEAVCRLLQDLGGSAFLEGDCLVVQGGTPLTGGAARSYGDHRIAMAAAVAASLCTGPVRLIGAEAVTKSYPRFWQDYQSLGGIWEEIS